MVEFNPDGSIKLMGSMAKASEENKEKLKSQRCIKVKREVLSYSAPKKCALHITLSEKFSDDRFINTIYNYFKQDSTVPSKIEKIGDRQFTVEIGTTFKRCTECNSLIYRFREFLDGNLIDEKGGCSFEGRKKNFCFEDHFE